MLQDTHVCKPLGGRIRTLSASTTGTASDTGRLLPPASCPHRLRNSLSPAARVLNRPNGLSSRAAKVTPKPIAKAAKLRNTTLRHEDPGVR